jgi:hypothetical protein
MAGCTPVKKGLRSLDFFLFPMTFCRMALVIHIVFPYGEEGVVVLVYWPENACSRARVLQWQ